MELRQAVDRDVEEVGSRVVEPVPARVVGRVAEAEVGSLVDDRRAVLEQARHEGGGRPVRQRQEGGIHRRQLGVDRLLGRGQMRVDPVDRVLVAAPAGEAYEVDVRMARKQPDQLRAHVAGRPDDPDPYAARPARRVDSPVATEEVHRSRRSRPSHPQRLLPGSPCPTSSSSHDYTGPCIVMQCHLRAAPGPCASRAHDA